MSMNAEERYSSHLGSIESTCQRRSYHQEHCWKTLQFRLYCTQDAVPAAARVTQAVEFHDNSAATV